MTEKGREMDATDWQSTESADAFPMMGMREGLSDDVLFPHARNSHVALLTRAIETEVIPRLLQARREAVLRDGVASSDTWQPTQSEVARFVDLLISPDEALAPAYLKVLSDKGIRLDSLYSGLLSEAARLLGTMWEDDSVDFTLVTTGVWRMQKMLRELSPVFAGIQHSAGPRILLVPAIGGQHSFGLAMVSEYFRRAGWDVCCEIARSNDDLAAMVRGSWFDMIGFSIGATDQLPQLTQTIRAARRASRNLRLGVLVGGPAFVAHPDLVAQVGADATGADAAQATVAAEALMASLATSA
jgi:methanogenic corrinoid protein MtbC1